MTLLDILPSLHNAARPRLDPAIWPQTTHVDEAGRVTVGGVALADIADEVGTPAYIIDEADIRYRARRCRKNAETVYSGSGLLTVAVARWLGSEGLGIAVCSPAELAVALAGGVDPTRIVWNATTHDYVSEATVAGVGRIVVDSPVEIAYLSGLAHHQPVLIRAASGVDPAGPVRDILAAPQLELVGVHCLGDDVRAAVEVLADIRARHRIILTEITVRGAAPDIDDTLDAACAAERFPRPRLILEEGDRISARAVVSLCRITAVTVRNDGRALATVDGSIGSLTALANRHSLGPTRPTTVVGADGATEVELPADIHPGDLLAGPRAPYRPGMAAALISVKDRHLHQLIRRETVADRLARDRG